MHRRTVLRTASVALGSALAGCINGATLADEQTPTEQTPDSGTDTETTTDGHSANEVTVELTIENRDERPHSGTVEVTHRMTPACRYSTPQCGQPSKRNVALDASFNLSGGGQRTFQPVTMGIETDSQTVDGYSVEVSTGSQTDVLNGLEAGAAQIVGREDVDKFPWRVVGRGYPIRAIITSDGIETAVQSVN